MPPEPGGRTLLGDAALLIVFLALAGGGVKWYRAHGKAPAPAGAALQSLPDAGRSLPPVSLPPDTPDPLPREIDSGGLDSADLQRGRALAERLQKRSPVGEADIAAAEDLERRNPTHGGVRDLLASLLLVSAREDAKQGQYTRALERLGRSGALRPDWDVIRKSTIGTLLLAAQAEAVASRFDEAATLLRRAAALDSRAKAPRVFLLGVLLETRDWPAAETMAREVLALDPRDPDALEGLGEALLREDHNKEAAEALQAALQIRTNPRTVELLARLQKSLMTEQGMTEQAIAHFHVRYDGEAHEEVGREILSALERHYSTLARTMDHQLTAPVAVILFSREAYYDAAGAPAWSGGAFDNTDGKIRIPIGGLTRSLTPDMDGTLIHELTHAFIFDRSKGVAPRDIHEGLAQYMEGKRLASLLRPDQMTLLADGRVGGVMGFYLSALSYVEYLVDTRGMGGMNDLLGAMGETGNPDEAFRRNYGDDSMATRRAWAQRLHQRYGS